MVLTPMKAHGSGAIRVLRILRVLRATRMMRVTKILPCVYRSPGCSHVWTDTLHLQQTYTGDGDTGTVGVIRRLHRCLHDTGQLYFCYYWGDHFRHERPVPFRRLE
jgi:hypothetical protein